MAETETGIALRPILDYVGQVYEETALLMKDLAAELKRRGFRSLVGNINGSNNSRLLDWPRQWLPRFVSGYWVPEGAPEKGRKTTYVAVSVLFADLSDRAVEPLLVYGLVSAMDHESATYQHWWLSDIHFNKDRAFDRTHEDEDRMRFRCTKYGADSYMWACSGVLLHQPLTNVTGSEDVVAISDQLETLWKDETVGR
jgi:hypothetical protein